MFALAVDDYGVALPAVGSCCFPNLFHQHAGCVIFAKPKASAHEASLILIGRAKSRDDNDVVGRKRFPQVGRALGSVDGVGVALVGLEIAQAASKQVLIDEWIVDQLG